MAVVHSQDSAYSVEMRRHNFYHTEFGPPGRQFVQKDYPAAMYKASRVAGQLSFEREEVADSSERERSERRGYVWGGQGEALLALEASELELAKLAANLNHQATTMSPKAAEEIRAAQAAAGARHIGEVPTQKRGRPRGRPFTKKAPVVEGVE